ncbi:HAD family hydrolase [Dermatophilus congolensis]|uniref:HAD family hydrolase n=1 Tax=Dermatophilus congolensis TaxID=1863 RepID=UPI001AAECAEC|nr:HAD-IA family hydrolase [Dermatophilus congolensis]MBO3152675.1 HAD-IA family hydrolase [Dermatophilus congolensis]MBO3160315.1 HAD-IA family hydrolase [Dermatophilus congolensis]MBO3163959.1 HAD-IA family hydrolase [Dermatophilus congolensis]MBO3177505.1 HAD-IA family hydrolase [Dermatophilus congolensis]
MDLKRYKAVLFDLDGVLTPTADVHMRAWSDMFNAFLKSVHARREKGLTVTGVSAEADLSPYLDDDYFHFVDGRPRYDGVRAFLSSRKIVLPEGDPEDSPDRETVCGLGNRKNDAFNDVLKRDGVAPYPGSLALLDALEGTGIHLAVVSSSANAKAVLTAAGIIDRFEHVVDGLVARAEGLSGKPSPATYLRGAQLCGATAAEAVVVEDATSGVAAGRAGGFALVLGVDRGAGAEALRAAGADEVVADLAEVIP